MPPLRDLLTRNWTLKLAALLLALLLWAVVQAEREWRRTVQAPVEVVINDPGWTLAAAPAPETVTLSVSGPVWELVRLGRERPRLIVPIDRVVDTTEVHNLQPGWVRLDGGLAGVRIESVRPSSVTLVFDEIRTRLVPVALSLSGELPDGFELLEPPRVDPPAIRVSGPGRRLEGLDSVRLEPLDLRRFRRSLSVAVRVDTTGLDGLSVAPTEAMVVFRIARLPPPEPADTLAEAASNPSTAPARNAARDR